MSVKEHLGVEGAEEEETRNRRDYVGKPKQCYAMVYSTDTALSPG